MKHITLMMSRILMIVSSIMISLILFLNPSISSLVVYASPAVVPVTAETVAALLVALGLMTGDSVNGYTWVGSDNPYVDSVFEEQISGITSGVPVSSDTLGKLSGTVIPEDVYTTDGTSFFVGEKIVTASDLFLKARALSGTSYYMPVNVTGIISTNQKTSGYFTPSFPKSSFGTDQYLIPYFTTSGFKSFIFDVGVNLISGSDTERIVYQSYRFVESSTNQIGFFLNKQTSARYLDNDNYLYLDSLYASSALPSGSVIPNDYIIYSGETQKPPFGMGGADSLINFGRSGDYTTRIYRVSGLGDYLLADITNTSLLVTSGVPVTTLTADSTSLGNSIVQVKQEDDDGDKGTPPIPNSPNNWELWKTFEDLIKFIDTGEVTNGGTDFGEFVNNNYNYVNVDVNVPDKIDQNINISGDFTIHEDISLPTGGDGSGFYSPDAVDAVSALVSDNPIVSLIEGVFKSIDPALVGIFSVSVSLLLVLGIWKLIRG